MKKRNSLKVATYNIQYSNNYKSIIQNVCFMAKEGVSVFCIQEVGRISNKDFIVALLLKGLGSEWDAVFHIGKEESSLGMGNCIIWNKKILQLRKTEKFLLPKASGLTFHEWLFAKLTGGKTVPYQRRTITAYFTFVNHIVRISSVHLDHTGGTEQRQKQLYFFLNKLKKKEVLIEIICGDFNSFDLMHSGREIAILEATFGNEFSDMSKNSGWTADLYNMDISRQFLLAKLVIRIFHIHIKRKLDYIWVKGMKFITCDKLELTGSDHLPVIVQLSLMDK